MIIAREPTSSEGLAAAIKAAGNANRLAKSLGISAAAIHRWGERNSIPADRVVEVEKVTGVPRAVLRPDLYAERVA